MTSRVTFSEDGHRYWLDGERVTSPTTATGKVLAKHALLPWASKLAAAWAADNVSLRDVLGEAAFLKQAAAAPTAARNAGADRGRILHDAAEQLVQGYPLTPVNDDGTPWPEDMTAAARQLAAFMDEHDVTPVMHETVVFHELHRWAGRLDLVATLKDGKTWLLDYTTGSGVYPEKALQLAAYRHATHASDGTDDMPMMPVDATGVVWVKPDGWELVPTRSDEQVYGYFCHVLALAAWADWRREDSLGAPIQGRAS